MGAMQGMHKACQFVKRRLISAKLLGGQRAGVEGLFFSHPPEISII